MNAHLMAVVSVYKNIVHDDCWMQSIWYFLSVVLLLYCNWKSVITSHLVNCLNCLLPQKCFKIKFYITVLMFYKWCTSCLLIICSTLVIKAQSLNFILSRYYMNFSLEEISLCSHANHFYQCSSGWENGCWLWLCIQLGTFELLSFRLEISIVCTERIACGFTCRRFYLTFWLLCPPFGMMNSPVMDWFHLFFHSNESISFSPMFPWPWP